MRRKRIINCSITGSIHTPSMSPYLPTTPDEIAQNAIDAANAGAATVHIKATARSNANDNILISTSYFVNDFFIDFQI